jgi:hypothetical protein
VEEESGLLRPESWLDHGNLVDHVIEEIHRIDVGGMDVRRDMMGKIEERFASTDERIAMFSQTSLGNRDQIAHLIQSPTELASSIQLVKDTVLNGNVGSSRMPENQSKVNSDCSRTLSIRNNLDSDRSRTLPNLSESNADRSRTLPTLNEINSGCSRTLQDQNGIQNLEILDCSRMLQNPTETNSCRR